MKGWQQILWTFIVLGCISGPVFTAAAANTATLKSRLAKNSKDMKARLDLAEAYLKKADYSATVDLLLPVSEELPRKGLLLLAKAYAGQKNSLQEIRVLELLWAKNDKDYYVQYTLGEAYAKLGKHEEAILNFDGARKLNPRFLPAYENLVKEYIFTKEHYEARTVLGDMIKLFGEKPSFTNELCRLDSTEGFIEKAIETCQTAIQANPQHPDNHVHLALSLLDKQSVEQAEKILKKAAQQFPKSEFTQWTAGNEALKKKDYAAAIGFFRQATKASPTSYRAFASLGQTALELKKLAEALDAFTKACQLERQGAAEVRRVASMLRQKRDNAWASKFDASLGKCKD